MEVFQEFRKVEVLQKQSKLLPEVFLFYMPLLPTSLSFPLQLAELPSFVNGTFLKVETNNI